MGLYDDDGAAPDDVPAWYPRELGSHGWGLAYDAPSSWRVYEDDRGERVLLAPEREAFEALEIRLTTLDGAPSLERHAAAAIEALRGDVPGVHVADRRFVRLDRVDAFEVAFEIGDRRAWRIVAVNGNVGVRITYAGRSEQFAAHEAKAREIVASVELRSGTR